MLGNRQVSMGILLEYIRNIGYFLILMSLVGNVMPDNSYKKYLKMFCGLILVVLVINPFYEFLNYDGSIKDIFKGARFDSEVAHIKGMLISNEENAKAQAIREYENILKEELQYIANNEGLYILDVKVKISENEEIELTSVDLYVTKDYEKYMDNNKMIGDEGESDNKIVIDKISIGEKDEIATESENRLNPSELVLIKEIADFLKIDSKLINVYGEI